MPRVKINLYANFRESVGERQITISGETVLELLQNLVDQYENLEKEIFETESRKNVRKHVNILLNGDQINVSADLDESVSEGDSVSIFPPVSGGAL